MSYKKVKDYFTARLNAKGFSEAGTLFDFQEEASLDKKFIFDHPLAESERPELNTTLHPQRTVYIKLAQKIGDGKTQVQDYNNMQILIDNLIVTICNPVNFQAAAFGIRNVTYRRHTAENQSDYVLFTLTFDVEDELTYA